MNRGWSKNVSFQFILDSWPKVWKTFSTHPIKILKMFANTVHVACNNRPSSFSNTRKIHWIGCFSFNYGLLIFNYNSNLKHVPARDLYFFYFIFLKKSDSASTYQHVPLEFWALILKYPILPWENKRNTSLPAITSQKTLEAWRQLHFMPYQSHIWS
jgi:hypothetical protein